MLLRAKGAISSLVTRTRTRRELRGLSGLNPQRPAAIFAEDGGVGVERRGQCREVMGAVCAGSWAAGNVARRVAVHLVVPFGSRVCGPEYLGFLFARDAETVRITVVIGQQELGLSVAAIVEFRNGVA